MAGCPGGEKCSIQALVFQADRIIYTTRGAGALKFALLSLANKDFWPGRRQVLHIKVSPAPPPRDLANAFPERGTSYITAQQESRDFDHDAVASVHVEPELLHTYSKYYKSDVLLLIVRLAVLTAVTLTVPVVLFPIRTSINHLLCPTRDFSWIRHTAITVVLLAGTNTLVIFVPTIRDIFGFIGASAAAMLIFILPSAFYIKLVKKESMKSVQKIGACAFLVCGIVVMFGSMTLIILDWIHNAMNDDGH
ncbi:unnamed protein product [Menidia menidia]|uniref:Sodium-coupled neutral amino acid symporter 2 n=1 Tax=Menidia menidia TaxID=238744 RepID=A0A8S4B2H2_9TELE|nr:unnamed protein product [Menidia menidia]